MRPFRIRSRPLLPGEGHNGKAEMDHSPFEQKTTVTGPGHFAEIVTPESPTFHDIRLLQGERFARATMLGQSAYLETVSVNPQYTVSIAVRRATGLLVGAALLELPSATNIEFMVEFRPGSASSVILAAGTFAEIRGLALRSGLDWQEHLDILDTLGNALVQIATQRNVAWLWTLPRQSVMSLMLAEIPGLLPAYRFTLCPDVLGWREGSEQLQKMRNLHMKALPIAPETLPIIYQASPTALAEDLARRKALWEQRHHTPDLSARLHLAMRQASRQVHAQIEWLNQRNQARSKHDELQELAMKQDIGKGKSQPNETAAPAHPTPDAARPESAPNGSHAFPLPLDGKGFLPGAEAGRRADYLRQFVEQGGAAATKYKALSYDLLDIQPGMQVLDVGCGVGLDLPLLADRVGSDGLVIGVDHDSALVQQAIEASAGHPNVRVTVGKAESLPFAHRSFDGVRADRVLQHIAQPDIVLAEMWRVLRPGGVVTLVEPDWKMVGLFPGSPAGGDDDHIWNLILEYNQREITHPLIGRQLSNLLSQPERWENVEVRVAAFVLTSWSSANAVLRLSEMAERLSQAEPARAAEVTAWLKELEAAEQRGAFLASMQLFYARARKVRA